MTNPTLSTIIATSISWYQELHARIFKDKKSPTSAYLLNASREYAIYTCEHRGIPHIGDGLKHVQRMALWMLRNRSEKIKTFALTGMLGAEQLHVHGEKSANDAIGLLAAPFKNNLCLIEGLGSFGSRTMPAGDGIGAPRYTEVRRGKPAELFLYRDLDLVPLRDNFDGSNKEPDYFLPIIPVILLNGVSGIAVGWSTDVLPHHPKTLIEATKAALLDKPIPVIEPYWNNYNITVKPTKKTNQWELSGKVEIVDTSTIRIIELPPGQEFSKEMPKPKAGEKPPNPVGFIEKLMKMEDEGKINGFSDRSTDSINITVRMPRGSVKDWTEDMALDFFKMRERTTERIVALSWDHKSMVTYDSPEALVKDFAGWRLSYYVKRYEKMLADTTHELRYWNALRVLFDKNFAERLGKFANRVAMQVAITETLANDCDAVEIDDDQMARIVGLPTYKWTEEFRKDVDSKVAEILKDLAHYADLLQNPDKIKKVYVDELDQLVKALK